ncbi:MAG: tRNA (guanine-N1-)-methyltransferase [Candidatus Magnetoglobus multicellularis str. Araruama]|uniref:tRNA (guanine-N(1)-)-methyltransferase n=1 Tax=Candidatus Magnetoglobus multicellularis str. Araruama TaxID=890399 RepID=A0A1V1PGY7_9BACT|nr:MAG: tRNA (guanine-N1-)-methyltransferase [Candidatus Magnetoglobus multicellularis str. Araruama]
MFDALFNHSIFKRACDKKLIIKKLYQIRDFAHGKHHITDDTPYGGGSGMVLKPEPLFLAIQKAKNDNPTALTILLTPQGKTFTQKMAWELSQESALILICGRYEGIDERIALDHIDLEISIGNFVLTGGEPAAMIVMDAISRLIPGVLGADDSALCDSYSDGLLEHAHYTRPEHFDAHSVPDVLLSGHHQNINYWRRESALIRTILKRPELFNQLSLTSDDLSILQKWTTIIETIIQKQSSRGPTSLSGSG